MKKVLFPLVVALFFVAVMHSRSNAANWPQWRGPRMNGSSPESDLPAEVGPETNLAWKTDLPGRGGSTPVVWGDRVFLTAQDAEKRTWAMALSAENGNVLWKHHVGSGYKNSRLQTACTPSPVTDGKRVWFLFGNGDLLACSVEGKKLWSRNLEDDYGTWHIRWDYGSSPLLWKGNLYIPVLHGNYRNKAPDEPQSYLLCLNPRNGKERWRHMRPSDANYEAKQAYTTPIPLQQKGEDQIIIAGADHVTGHAASTGRELWRSPTYNPRDQKYFPTVASPLVAEEMVLVSAPRGSALYAIRSGTSEWAWTKDRKAGFSPTPAYYRGHAYVLNDQRRRILMMDAQTGEVRDSCQLEGRGMLHPSPTAADGKIYCMDGQGTVTVISAGKPMKILHRATFGNW